MSTDTERLERLEKIRARLTELELLGPYLSDEDLALIEDVVTKETKRLRKAVDFRVEARRQREGLSARGRLGSLHPASNLKRKQGQRDASELPL